MNVVVDCHIHLYRMHDEGALFDAALRQLARLDAEARPALILAERINDSRFLELSKGFDIPAGFSVSSRTEISITLKADASGKELEIVAGRQIATEERLEVLSWFSEREVQDGMPLAKTLEKVVEIQGIPVLTWAPGKWSGRRGKLISAALRLETCRPLFLCDTTLRPRGWPEPSQFKEARALGLKIFAGSDPLPMPGEETQAGRFGVVVELGPDATVDGPAIRDAMIRSAQPEIVGRRNGPIAWVSRYCGYMLSRRKR